MLSPSQPSTARSPASKSKKRTPSFGRVFSKVVLPTPLGPKIAALMPPRSCILSYALMILKAIICSTWLLLHLASSGCGGGSQCGELPLPLLCSSFLCRQRALTCDRQIGGSVCVVVDQVWRVAGAHGLEPSHAEGDLTGGHLGAEDDLPPRRDLGMRCDRIAVILVAVLRRQALGFIEDAGAVRHWRSPVRRARSGPLQHARRPSSGAGHWRSQGTAAGPDRALHPCPSPARNGASRRRG